MEGYVDLLSLLSILLLISSFVLVANKRVDSYIKTFRLQSILLALIAGVYSFHFIFVEKKIEGIVFIFLLIIGVKVILIPMMLKKTLKRVEYKIEKDFFINIPASIIICCGLLILTWYIFINVPDLVDKTARMYLTISVSVIMIGLFFMITRKKAIGQIIGLLVIENGLFMAAILTTSGMPMIVELGIFFDVLMAVIVLGIFVFRINETFESIDINKLRKLKG